MKILQPDGTYCYSGLQCRKHGSFNKQKIEASSIGFLPEPVAFPLTKTRSGLNNFNDDKTVSQLNELKQSALLWQENLTDEEKNSLKNYVHMGYMDINEILYNHKTPNEREKRTIQNLDYAFLKAPIREETLLYRGFKTDNKTVFLDSLTKKGEIFFPSYTSTSIDSDLMIHRMRNKKTENYLVFEIISNKGGAVEPELYTGGQQNGMKSISYYEKEVLLPRNLVMRVENVIDNVTFKSTLNAPVGGNPTMLNMFKQKKITVVQLRDISNL